MKKTLRLIVLLLLPILLLWTNDANALQLRQGEVGGHVYGYEQSGGTVTDVDVKNETGEASYNYPLPAGSGLLLMGPYSSMAEVSGYADPGVTTPDEFSSGAYARAQSDSYANIYSYFGNTFTVDAGTSGLSLGAATTVTINFSLDGVSDVGGDRYAGYSSWVDVFSTFRVWDDTIENCGEGCSPGYLIDFEADILHTEDAYGAGEIYNRHSTSWTTKTWNVDTENFDTVAAASGESFSDWYLDYNQFRTCIGGEVFCTDAKTFDTGLISMTFDTYIGAELNYFSRLGIFSQANGVDAMAYGNYLTTFGGSATAGTAGVELSFLLSAPQDTGGGASVPEPSTLLLLGSGIVGLGFVRRRFKR